MGISVEILRVARSFEAAFLQTTLLGQIAFCLSLPLIWTLISQLLRKLFSRGLNPPVLGKPSGPLLPMWRARLRYIFHGIDMIKDGYEKVALAISNKSVQLLTWWTF